MEETTKHRDEPAETGRENGHNTADSTTPDGPSRATLSARLEQLEAENHHLRAEYGRVRQSRYRKRALGLAAIGLCAIGGAVAFPNVQDVLLALGGTGLIGAVLTYYLAPEQFVAADIGERIYTALATNQARLTDALGLSENRHYVPTKGNRPGCRLIVPRSQQYHPPETVDGDSDPIVTAADHRGLRLEPSGLGLFEEFDDALTTERARTPDALATQLTSALVEQFELAARAEPAVGPEQVTFAITDSTFGDCDRFDHPVASFLAVSLAIGLERPITLEVAAADNRTDWLLTCRWERNDKTDDK
ncbi:hypothetical protein B2G88_12555 [Natronolimnobius baerhuensis]|uniref:DUF7982 domain-containing protein n=1 Tax=Natronolimnobius baerhuensis TaxID=253108 RepID=A0A202EAF3_9EURY|nr:hypothetical protein B2G88_12555 [Natronolimnobius baerhuensis]